MLLILGNGGTLPIQDNVINDFANGNLTPAASWIVMLVVVAVYAADRRGCATGGAGAQRPRRTAVSITLLKIVGASWPASSSSCICNANRGISSRSAACRGSCSSCSVSSWSWTVLLGRTRFGRYLYAIGGNAEAARRGRRERWRGCARTASCSVPSPPGMAGIIYASRLRSISTNARRRNARALRGRGGGHRGHQPLRRARPDGPRASSAASSSPAIDNGMSLQGFSSASKYIVTAIVLLVAVSIDAARRHQGLTGSHPC